MEQVESLYALWEEEAERRFPTFVPVVTDEETELRGYETEETRAAWAAQTTEPRAFLAPTPELQRLRERDAQPLSQALDSSLTDVKAPQLAPLFQAPRSYRSIPVDEIKELLRGMPWDDVQCFLNAFKTDQWLEGEREGHGEEDVEDAEVTPGGDPDGGDSGDSDSSEDDADGEDNEGSEDDDKQVCLPLARREALFSLCAAAP